MTAGAPHACSTSRRPSWERTDERDDSLHPLLMFPELARARLARMIRTPSACLTVERLWRRRSVQRWRGGSRRKSWRRDGDERLHPPLRLRPRDRLGPRVTRGRAPLGARSRTRRRDLRQGAGRGETGRAPGMTMVAERFFRDSDYWRAWSGVPDMTADIPYALAALDPGDRRVLDVPCGRGRLLKAVRAVLPGAELRGHDVNAAMIEQVRRECPGVLSHVGSVYALPFPDRHFDAVLCHESFMHFEEPRRALAELGRVANRRLYLSVTTRRQLNTLVRRVGLG